MDFLAILVDKGVLNAHDLTAVRNAQAESPSRPLHTLLLERGWAKEETLLPALADYFSLDLVDLTKVTISPETLRAPCPPSWSIAAASCRSTGKTARWSWPRAIRSTCMPWKSCKRSPACTSSRCWPVRGEIARLIKTHFGVGGETVTAMVQEREASEIELLEETRGRR